MESTNKVAISIYIEESQREQVRAIKNQVGIPYAVIFRRALAAWLTEWSAANPLPPQPPISPEETQ